MKEAKKVESHPQWEEVTDEEDKDDDGDSSDSDDSDDNSS